MFNILVENIREQRAEFDAVHQGDFYGGSDVANICGVGYESPLAVWLRKTGKAKPVVASQQMILGQLMEPVLLELFRAKTGQPAASVNQIWQSVDRPWMIASPDAITIIDDKAPHNWKPNLIEFKTHKIYAERYWSETSASDSAMCQIAWYMAVSGYEGGYCAALIGGDTDKFFTPHFDADKALQSQLIEQVEKFRALVKADTPPGAGPGDADLIKSMLKDPTDTVKDLTETHLELMQKYVRAAEKASGLKEQLDPVDAEIKALKNQLLLDSAGAKTLIIGAHTVKINKIVKKEYTVKPSEYFTVTVKGGEK